ncbi:glycosyltransferase [Microbacterium gorillae]|uniref:glycosyltransferase n=1 Tax=Microbacterium gorillae TaxID=1231063 RepID=UPI00058C26C0|nr:glycosyltransferase [Microbacterium gorillae]
MTTPLRVMQSFGAPRATTNPYIHLLDGALARTDGITHLRFDRRRALLGRYDVLHLHWPETLLGGAAGARALARRAYVAALVLRLRFSRIAVVRTAHNVDLPRDVTPFERRLLEAIERRTDLRIVLNDHTVTDPGAETAMIPHGDFRSWFADLGVTGGEAVAGRLGFVGLVRRYKGVEHLIETFRATTAADLRLHISGNPTSAELADEVRALASGDARISTDLRFLDEAEFASAIRSAEGVVLPYRFMHNSGSVLAALSLERPVLVPRNDVNADLAAEVGPGWVLMYDGELDADDLTAFLPAVRAERVSAPDLSARTWDSVGARHREAFRRAVAARAATRKR